MELWVAGYPSFVGGADTELDHNIDLWRRFGVCVNLVPMPGCDLKMKLSCDNRGCITHAYNPKIFRDKTVVSFCNGNFLDKLPEIIEQGRPRSVIWFNCMTWPFDKEKLAHKAGWIDYFGFVSRYQEQILRPQLEAEGRPVVKLEGYRPYFNAARVPFQYRPPMSYFCMGRISRDDPGKFSEDMWRIFYKVNSPRPTKTFVLGWGPKVEEKCGPAPAEMDWQIWPPGAISVDDFYRRLHVVIHKTGGSRESYCRIVPECYAYGVPIIVEDDFAFPELVIDGETGFRCGSSEEMSYRASLLAFDEPLRKRIVEKGRMFLENKLSDAATLWEAWRAIQA